MYCKASNKANTMKLLVLYNLYNPLHDYLGNVFNMAALCYQI